MRRTRPPAAKAPSPVGASGAATHQPEDRAISASLCAGFANLPIPVPSRVGPRRAIYVLDAAIVIARADGVTLEDEFLADYCARYAADASPPTGSELVADLKRQRRIWTKERSREGLLPSAALDVPRLVGDRDRHFVVGELIGRGGFGDVYAAKSLDGEDAAIKFLHAHHDDPDSIARFEREAKGALRIESPFVAQVLAAGRTEEGIYWIAYERLFGETLEERLVREGSLPVAMVAAVVDDALYGLEAAHAVGVIHRDVKPSNIFLVRKRDRDHAVLIDFGLAMVGRVVGTRSRPKCVGHRPKECQDAVASGLTSASQVVGTLAYMAPEQFLDASRVDARADLYALGIVAFRALTGRLPFEGEAMAVMHGKLRGKAPSLSERTVRRARSIESVVGRALARRRADRYAGASEMRGAWRAIGEIRGRRRELLSAARRSP